jgi:hypothetical protein
VRVTLAPATANVPEARLRVERTAQVGGAKTYEPATSLKQERGAYVVPLGTAATTVELRGR